MLLSEFKQVILKGISDIDDIESCLCEERSNILRVTVKDGSRFAVKLQNIPAESPKNQRHLKELKRQLISHKQDNP